MLATYQKHGSNGVETMANQAYRHILDQVLSNQLKPGDWIDRRKVAAELNASLMPVAEAILRLTSEGFLTAVPRRGTQVRTPSPDDIRGQVLVRMALECQGARLYCGPRLKPIFASLLKLAKQVDDFKRQDKMSLCLEVDLAFHRALMSAAHCPVLLRSFDHVMSLALFQHTTMLMFLPIEEGDKHVDLLNDLCVMDSDAAERRMRAHISCGKDVLLANLTI